MRNSGLRWKFEQGRGEQHKCMKRSSETKTGAECQSIVVEPVTPGSLGGAGRLGKRMSKDRDLCQEKEWAISSKEIGFDMNYFCPGDSFKGKPHPV